MPEQRAAAPALKFVLRHEHGAVLAGLVRRLGDLDLAEDAFQEALVEAWEHWPAGTAYRTVPPPGSPPWRGAEPSTGSGGSDCGCPRRRRRSGSAKATRSRSHRRCWRESPILMTSSRCCCWLPPGAAPDAQVALTLRAVGGLTTPEIAAAFLVPEATMAQRISPSQAEDQRRVDMPSATRGR